MGVRRRMVGLVCIGAGLVAAPGWGQVTGEQVRQAIDRGVRAIERAQLADGTWPEEHYPGGESCLATLALLQAGVAPDEPHVVAALKHIRQIELRHTYVVALKLMALQAADPKAYRREIDAAAKWLVDAQNETGLWSYTRGERRFDHSNSQFALLGLHTAAQQGVRIPGEVWESARAAVLRTQNRDGGWAYMSTGNSYGSMTAAGVSDLLILGRTPLVRRERGFRDGAAPSCGEYGVDRALAGGLNWLARHFRADGNPQGALNYQYYWLYTLERCGILSGLRSFGTHDWYRAGAAQLVRTQGANGQWTGDLPNTCFAVLFLVKGRKPLLVQKLAWSGDDAWNPDRFDLEHLVSFVGDRLGEPVAWQVVGFDRPLEEWLAAPLLYMQGHRFPDWDANAAAKVRAFVEQGGTVLFEACCGRAEFADGCAAFIQRAFPEAPLRELERGHAVYSTLFSIEPWGLQGVEVGCRTSVLLSPRDLSCLWEQASIPELSDRAFQLGANIAAYVSGRRPLRDRLDVVVLPDADAPPAEEGRAVRLAQVVYDGDWRPDPQALVRLAEFLRDEVGLSVVTRYRTPALREEELANCPVLFMTGHVAFATDAGQRAALAAYLRRGGFLLAEACCGRPAFDAAFREFIAAAVPESALARLPADHALLRGEPGFAITAVHYKPRPPQGTAQTGPPELWGLVLDGRLCVVYSPVALGCGIDGHVCFDCRGLESADARRVAANVILHALTR